MDPPRCDLGRGRGDGGPLRQEVLDGAPFHATRDPGTLPFPGRGALAPPAADALARRVPAAAADASPLLRGRIHARLSRPAAGDRGPRARSVAPQSAASLCDGAIREARRRRARGLRRGAGAVRVGAMRAAGRGDVPRRAPLEPRGVRHVPVDRRDRGPEGTLRYALAQPRPPSMTPRSLSIVAAVSAALAVGFAGADGVKDGDWRSYGRDPGGQRFSTLAEIDRGNVGRLRRARAHPPRGPAAPLGGGQPLSFAAPPP